jgi:hypothetical protein
MKNSRGLGLLLWCWPLLMWTAPLNGQEGPWRFVVFGDSIDFSGWEVNTNILGELASAAVGQNAALLIFAGDFSSSGSATALELWTNTARALYQAGIKVYPTVGNHDLDRGAYTNMVAAEVPENGPPGELKTTYALAWNNALFLVLNQFTPTNSYRVDQAWVDSVLATNTLPHVFAVGHVPAFRIYHYDCLDNFVTNRDQFWNSLSNAQCRIYFCGHDHFYDHSQIDDGDGDPQNDLHQLVVGTGGAPLYPDSLYGGNNSHWTPRRIKHEAQFGYLLAEVNGDNVSASWHSRTGSGTYTVSEVFSYSLRRRPFLHHHFAEARLTLTWSGAALLETSPNLSGPFRPVRGAVSPYVTTNIGGARAFYRLMEQPEMIE